MNSHVSDAVLHSAVPVDRAVFLKQIVELFVSTSVRSTKELETIAGAITNFLREASDDTAACIAQTLVLSRRLDEGMIAAFLRRHDLSTRIILSEASWLPRSAILGAATGPRREEAAAITARADLDLLILHFLLNRNDPAVDILLVENHEISIPYAIMERLMIRAMVNPSLAQPLLERSDLSINQRACLLPAASFDTAMNVLRQFADSEQNFRLKGPSNDYNRSDSSVLNVLMRGGKQEFYIECARSFHVSLGHIERLARDHNGIGLAILLISLGMNSTDLVQTIKYIFDFENKFFFYEKKLKYIIGAVKPATARWIIQKMFSVPLDENTKAGKVNEIEVKESIFEEKSDVYSYAKQLRIA